MEHKAGTKLSLEQIRKQQKKAQDEMRSAGDVIADGMAKVLGSWPFIIGQTIFVTIWLSLNLAAVAFKWDPYPFILLNLMFSIQAAYSAPIIMMSQNRAADRDREQAALDYKVNQDAEERIRLIQDQLERIEGSLASSGVPTNTLHQDAATQVATMQSQLDRIEARLAKSTPQK